MGAAQATVEAVYMQVPQYRRCLWVPKPSIALRAPKVSVAVPRS
jgi:hypothetical protein